MPKQLFDSADSDYINPQLMNDGLYYRDGQVI